MGERTRPRHHADMHVLRGDIGHTLVESAGPFPPAGSARRGHDPAPSLRRRARRHRRRAGGDLHPPGRGQHLGGDPRHRAGHSPAVGHPLADHRAVVRRAPSASSPPWSSSACSCRADGSPPDGAWPGWPRSSCASCSTRCWAPPAGRPPIPDSPASTRASRSFSWPSPLPSLWRALPYLSRPMHRLVVGAIALAGALCGRRLLRPAARRHRRGDRRVGHGSRLPPRHGRAQRPPVGLGGDRRRARPAGRGARADAPCRVRSGAWRPSPAPTPRASRSSWRSTGATPPTPSGCARCGASASTATRGPPSSSTGCSRWSTRPT